MADRLFFGPSQAGQAPRRERLPSLASPRIMRARPTEAREQRRIMAQHSNLRTGGQILVDQLRIHGADLAFGVPGESYLALLDALHDEPALRFVICRHESGASMMAEAYGKLTGRPGIAMVTRGPGATNGAHGVHVARQDSTPMILFIGQVAREMRGREAFQEIDYRAMFGSFAKWVCEIDDPARIPELVSRAFYTATSGRPGPVVIALPEDMLAEQAAASDGRPYRIIQPHPAEADMARLRELLGRARRPFMILGGGGWDAGACADIRAFAETFDLPVGVSFRRQDYFDNTHPNYAGHVGISVAPPLSDRVKEADVLLLVGTRLGEASSRAYTLIDMPSPTQTLVHVHPGAEELGLAYQPELPIHAGMRAFAAAARALEPVDSSAWREETRRAHEQYLASIEPRPTLGALQLGEVVVWLRENLPEDAIITNGAGNYCVWVNGYYQYRRYRSQLGPTSGSMGYGTPAAVAAKLVHPERTVVCFAGDGCFLMTGQEIATAAQYELPVIFLVVNNSMYGTIRMHQERDYPGRVSGTDLANPDFAALARAYGGHGEVVERTADFPDAFRRAQTSGRMSLLELRVDPEAITPKLSISEIRAGAMAKA
jgi:acetolactate synthase-1/2/3 large subunit